MTGEGISFDWKLSDYQYDFLTNPAKFKAFISAIGAGKTATGWMRTVMEAVMQPGSVGVIVTSSYRMVDDALLQEMPNWLPHELILKDNRFKHNIVLRNGTRLFLRSADNLTHINRLRGISAAWFWIDEVTLTPQILWDILLGRLRQPGFKHSAWVTGTPKPNSWVKPVLWMR